MTPELQSRSLALAPEEAGLQAPACGTANCQGRNDSLGTGLPCSENSPLLQSKARMPFSTSLYFETDPSISKIVPLCAQILLQSLRLLPTVL